MCFHVLKHEGAAFVLMAAALPRGSLWNTGTRVGRKGLRKTKCRYVLMFKQKAMKWNKTRKKERPNFIFVTENTTATRSWKHVYMEPSCTDGINNSYNIHNSYWLVLNCWLTMCFKHVWLVTTLSLFNTEASLRCSMISCLFFASHSFWRFFLFLIVTRRKQ